MTLKSLCLSLVISLTQYLEPSKISNFLPGFTKLEIIRFDFTCRSFFPPICEKFDLVHVIFLFPYDVLILIKGTPLYQNFIFIITLFKHVHVLQIMFIWTLYFWKFCIYMCTTGIFMPPRSKIGGHIVFVLSVILSFCHSLWNFNLANNFWTVSARALMFHMSISCDKTFLW